MARQGVLTSSDTLFAATMKALVGEAPELEYRFSSERGWRFDYAWPVDLVAVEVEGGIWRKGGGAHSRPSNILRDIEKYNAALESHWIVYRCLPGRLLKAAPAIARLIELRRKRAF